MYQDFSRAAMNMCRVVMYPLIKMFLRMGISHKALTAITKRVYVDIAMETGPSKRNISDISARTGISRKGVGKVLDEVEELTISESRRLAVNKVIDNWYLLKDYQNAKGQPKPLALTHESEICLEHLVRTAKLDIPSTTVCRLLIQSGNIAKNKSGLFYPLSDQHMYLEFDNNAIEYLQSALFSYSTTLYRNVFCGDESESPRLFDRRAYASCIPREKLDEFRKLAETRGDSVVRELNNWLIENSTQRLSSNPHQGLTGISVFTFDYSKLPYS